MTDQEPAQKKRLILQALAVGVVDVVLLIALNSSPKVWLILVVLQALTGLLLILRGGDRRPLGKALVYGIGGMVAIGGGLGLLLFAVCSGA
jgi:hypothetical protein